MTAAAPRTPPITALDDLARLCESELRALYDRGRMPDSLAALDGQPLGRMLAVRGLDGGAIGRGIARLAAHARFPWGGKSFRADSETASAGRGINRVRLGGRHQLFPFRTALGPSELDGGPCVRLDYDLAVNPGPIRAIHDEVRQIRPGLFLGPAMLKGAGGPRLVLWFALDTGVQSAAPLWAPDLT